jgi:hypothetical protein
MAIKFVNLLSKYLPAHFKIAPKDVEVYLDEPLELVPIERNKYLVGTLNPDSTEIEYNMGDNTYLLKDKGVVKIENEYIKYDTNDLVEHKLKNLERGFFGTEATAHCNEVLWGALLAEEIDAYTTTVNFTSISDVSAIPKQGKFALFSDNNDLEVISYSGYNQWLNGYQFTNVTRGDDGTTANNHGKGAYLQEYSDLLISEVETIKYDKGLWSATLATALTETSTEAVIASKFVAALDSAMSAVDKIVYLKNIVGTVPKNGYILIDNEIIRYGKFTADPFIADSGYLEQCIRGSQSTTGVIHLISAVVYYTFPQNGEFLVDNEYIRYTAYDKITRTFSGLLRGRYETTPDTHTVGTSLTERRHTELEPMGVFRIGNEYFKYWYLDNEYFYIDKRPALNAKTYYHTTGANVTSIIEAHYEGEVITTYHFDDENSYLVDFIHTVAEHLDLAINTKIDSFENFSDVDTVDANYLKYIVKELGENLEDYQNLPFFTGANSDYRTRLFTKELVNIYKEKGLLVALKLWHTIISEPLTSYQDLWTFNYCSFYSLPFLVLLLYEPLRTFYPSNENFFRPQISKALQEELAEFYEDEKIKDVATTLSYAVPDLKLLVHEWNYFRRTDDDLKSSGGGSFDDKLVPCDSANDLGINFDQTNVELQVRDTSTTLPLPFYVEDYDVDLFKFEEELDATKDEMPTSSTVCEPTKTDEGLISDYSFEWIRDIYGEDIFDYCTLSDRLEPIRTDLNVLRDLTSDISNASLELDHNIGADDTEIIVKVIDGKLYDPADHIITNTNPNIVPKGFVKFGNEIISYTGVEFYDHHEGTFTDKRYKLTGCTRGVNSTTASAYQVNIYEGNERLLAGNYIEVVYDPHVLYCSVDIIDNILTHVNHGLVTNDIILFDPSVSGGGIIGTKTTDAIPSYYYVYKINADSFKISLTPITGTLTPVDITSNTPVTCHKIYFRLLLTRDPKGYGISVGDYLQLVQTGYNYQHLITAVISEYNYCTLEHTYGIDFVTGVLPIPTVKTLGAAGLPSLAPITTFDCRIDEDNFTINYIDSDGNTIVHGLSDADVIYFLASVGNIDAYTNYYVKVPAPDYFEITASMTPWGVAVTSTASNTFSSGATAHGLNDGDLIVFSGTGGNIDSGKHYLVGNVTTYTFKIRDILTGELITLNPLEANTISYSSLALTNINNPLNTYMISGTRVISTEEGYQHRYSLIQHLLWRLDNEVNGNDLSLVYGFTTSELKTKKLNSYTGVRDGIIWPTPHFKYGFEISTADIGNFPPDEVVELVLRKLKQYKPKHTVADLTVDYPLGGNQLAMTPMMENFETENLMSDAYRTFNGTTDNITNTITAYNHDLREAESIYIEGGDGVGLTFGTIYYVKYVDANSFQVSTSTSGTPPDVISGPAVTLTGVTTVVITQAPVAEYRIELDHDVTDSVIDKTYDLPIITLDEVVDYGSTADFFYIWKDGTSEQTTFYYSPFVAYPYGLKTDVYRNRKRFLSYVD